jgi:HD-GYP domain-containing protein (c-di-GMP phosphodiesterase class II)
MRTVESELREHAGTQFDPDIVEIILKGMVSLV